MNCVIDPKEHNDVIFKLIDYLNENGVDMNYIYGSGSFVEYKLVQPKVMYNDKFGMPYPERLPYVKIYPFEYTITAYPDKVKINGSYLNCEADVARQLYEYFFKFWCDNKENKVDDIVKGFLTHLKK